MVLRIPEGVIKKVRMISKLTETTEEQVIAILLVLASMDLDKKSSKAGKVKKESVNNLHTETSNPTSV
jgi:hypothetical protein